jgi:hypothetical protein
VPAETEALSAAHVHRAAGRHRAADDIFSGTAITVFLAIRLTVANS